MVNLKLEMGLDTELFEEINVNGESYYKLTDKMDEAIKERVLKEIAWKVYDNGWNDDFKKVVKEFLNENKAEIIDLAAKKISISVMRSKELKK